MFDSILELGEKFLAESPDAFLKSLVKYKVKQKEERTILRIIFDLTEKNIETDAIKLNERRCEEYWWIGNTFRAAREPVLRLTSDDPKYLFERGCGIDGIANTIEKFPTEFRYKASIKNLYDLLKKIKEKFDLGEVKIDDDKADLYTVSIRFDGKEEDLAKTEGYKDFLEVALTRVHEIVEGKCYLCGHEGVLLDPGFPSGSLLKMYVLDKKGFLSGISDTVYSKLRTFATCPLCLKKLLIGSGRIEQELRATIGDLNLYIVPRSSLDIDKLESFIPFVKDKFDTIKTYEKLEKFDQQLKNYGSYVENEPGYTLNLIFGQKEQASFNFYYEITEVPISSLTSFTNDVKHLASETGKIFGNDEKKFDIGFEGIYRIFPLSRRKTKTGIRLEGYAPLILLYSSLLQRHAYPEEDLMKRALLLARIHRYGLYGAYNIRETKSEDIETCYGMIKFNMLLKLLKSGLSMMSQEDHEIETSISEDITNYFILMKYENWQRALFLIGYLIGEVGRQQYLKGDEKKSILSKINFDGMGSDKVVMLSNQIVKSLRDYRILMYNEALYAEMKRLLDNNLDRINDPVRNVFYILSGYSFSTIKSIIGSSATGDTI